MGAYGVVFIGRADIKEYLADVDNIEFIDEAELQPNLNIEVIKQILIDHSGSPKRAGWYFQQFSKMAYALICEDEYYLVWDSDTLPLKKINFFNERNQPIISYRSFEKFDTPYYETIKSLLGIEIKPNKTTKSYVAEHMLFNVSIMKDLIQNISNNNTLSSKSFFEIIIDSISKEQLSLSGYSEFETYIAFVQKYYPDTYVYRQWNNLRSGKVFLGQLPDSASLEWIGQKFDSVSIERYDMQFRIFSYKFIQSFKFGSVYSIVAPVIKLIHSFRMIIRKYLKPLLLRLYDPRS